MCRVVKPLPNHVKVNVQASFGENSLRGKARAVIRDSTGSFIAGSNTKVIVVQDALTAEAYGRKQDPF